jgi:hypothetical protein
MRPASSSTRRCFMKPGSDMLCGAASSLTGRLPPSSNSRTPRRVGSARAAKTASRGASSYLTIRFSIRFCPLPCQGERCDCCGGSVLQKSSVRRARYVDARVGEEVGLSVESLTCPRALGRGGVADYFAIDDTSAGRPFAHLPAQCACFPPQITSRQQRNGSHGREYQKREHEYHNKHRGTRHRRQKLAEKARSRRTKARVVAGESELFVVCKHSLPSR